MRQLHLDMLKPGGQEMLLRSFSGSEQMGRLFQYELDLLCTKKAIPFDEVVGKVVTVSLDLPNGEQRHFQGHISRLVQNASSGTYAHFQATVVPKLWFLTRKANCRIFQKKDYPTIADVIFKVLDEHSITYEKHLDLSLYREWEYCVQYRETDFNFVSRLMEQHGMYYYFKHTDSEHTMILCDSMSKHDPYSDFYEQIRFQGSEVSNEMEQITDWTLEKGVQPAEYTLADFDFKKPSPVIAFAANESDFTHAGSEIYDYAGEFTDLHTKAYVDHKQDGEHYAVVQAQEVRAQSELCQGSGNARGVSPGHKFTLMGSPRGETETADYVITAATYQAYSGEFDGSGGGGDTSFNVSLSAIEAETQFRPARATAKPVVQGAQTAIVVGPSGEEIHTDEFGRVKVQFHWDREGKFDENSSCWIRVSQVHAGKGFGGVDIPRIGEEVVIGFLEGDPDRPIVIGRVYNADCKPPGNLPADKVSSGLKSNSTPGGGGANSISMDDTKGKEMLGVVGQFDMSTSVGNDQTNDIGNNRTSSVAVDDTESVGSNQTIDVGSNQSTTVGADQSTAVSANQTLSVGADQTNTISANQTSSIGADQGISVGANRSVDVGASESVTVGASKTESISAAKDLSVGAIYSVAVGGLMNEAVGGAKMEEIGGAKMVEVGAISMEDVGANKSVEAGVNISHEAGANISEKAGANINCKAGAAVNLKAGAGMNLKASGALKAQSGGACNIKAGGALKQQGASVKIKGPTKIIGATKITGATKIKGNTLKIT